MEFFTLAIGTLKVVAIALGAGLTAWGGINLIRQRQSSVKSQGRREATAEPNKMRWTANRLECIEKLEIYKGREYNRFIESRKIRLYEFIRRKTPNGQHSCGRGR